MAADPLQAAFERYLADCNESALLLAIQRYGGRAPSCDFDWPSAHRIGDISLGGSSYRVIRVFDPDDRSTRLYIYSTNSPHNAEPGVPFRLQGEALQRWIEDELQLPTKAPVPWSRYDSSLSDDV